MQKITICSILALAAVAVVAEPPVRDYLPPNVGGGPGGYPSGPSGGGYPSGPTGGGAGGFPSGPIGGGSGGFPSGPIGGGAGGYPSGPSGPGAGGPGGDDGPSEPANYEFSYEVKDAASGNDFGHSESRQGDVATGKYYVVLPDGRKQIVEYTADSEGYKPKITYEGEANTGGAGGYPSGPSGPSGPSTGNGGYPSGPSTGNGGYPSGPSTGNGGYPSGPSSGNGGYPSGPSGGNSGYKY